MARLEREAIFYRSAEIKSAKFLPKSIAPNGLHYIDNVANGNKSAPLLNLSRFDKTRDFFFSQEPEFIKMRKNVFKSTQLAHTALATGMLGMAVYERVVAQTDQEKARANINLLFSSANAVTAVGAIKYAKLGVASGALLTPIVMAANLAMTSIDAGKALPADKTYNVYGLRFGMNESVVRELGSVIVGGISAAYTGAALGRNLYSTNRVGMLAAAGAGFATYMIGGGFGGYTAAYLYNLDMFANSKTSARGKRASLQTEPAQKRLGMPQPNGFASLGIRRTS
jgi:hypothetical protein